MVLSAATTEQAEQEPSTITGIAEATAERMRLGGEILNALAHAVAANEEAQRRFRAAVLIRLSKIDTVLTEVQGAQLAELWAPGKVSDEQRSKYVQEVQERVSRASNEMGLKMVKYIYGVEEEADVARGRTRNWSGWEI